MSILEITENTRKAARDYGQYRLVAQQSGVGFQWLTKFSTGAIANPTVENVARLEAFFKRRAVNDVSKGDPSCN